MSLWVLNVISLLAKHFNAKVYFYNHDSWKELPVRVVKHIAGATIAWLTAKEIFNLRLAYVNERDTKRSIRIIER